MNPFIAIMVFFALLGLFDEIIGGKLGVKDEFQHGLATMGGLSLSCAGFYSIGVSFVQNNAEAISAATPNIAVFTGALTTGGLGMTIGYQLPVFLGSVRRDEIDPLIRGFIAGLITFPAGLLIGGLILELPLHDLIMNILPSLIICILLSLAVVFIQSITMKVLTVFSNFFRILSYVFFVLSLVGMFVPDLALVDQALVEEILYMVLRMVIVACGGMVLSKIVLTWKEEWSAGFYF